MEDLDFIAEIEKLCREAGAFQLKHFRSVRPDEITDKGVNQLVSFVDVETEKLLVAGCQKLTPNCAFITEENTSVGNSSSHIQWIIDPLDGTTNFLHGLSAFSISIAMVKNGQLYAGAVYIPMWDEMFTAVVGKGAFKNGVPISVSQNNQLSQTLVATGFPYYEYEEMEPFMSVLRTLMKRTRGLRRMGSAAIDLAYTASGHFDAFFESGLHAWDVAAGILLVQEAGGIVSDYSGGSDFLYGKKIIASSAQIYSEFQTVIATEFKS